MRRHHRASSQHGLSVIEILVILAVIAILLSILFPVLSRSRDSSYRAQCAGNLKQLSCAITLYAYDWQGYWPGPGGLRGDRTYWSQTGTGGLESYIKQRGLRTVWCCPLTPEWTGPFPPRSYSMNSLLRTPADVPYPECVTYPTCLGCQCGIYCGAIQSPSHTILLFEAMPLTNGCRESLDYLYRCANWTKVRGFTKNVVNTIEPGQPWHTRVNNYLYCDGHVVARPPGRRTGADLSTGSEMYQWYVNKGKFMDIYNSSWRRTAPWE